MDFGFELLKALLALLFVLGVLALVLKLVKGRILPQRGIIEMLHYQPLGPKRGLAIVRVSQEYMLVGLGDESVCLLTKLDADRIEKELNSMAAAKAALQESPMDRIRALFGRRGK
ncbi:MAG: flagellar biosynthetic protein FliP [Nitrospirae bacterium]|nr:MAG: flagellar biosynthetic protein FliP [Nitrospirota bacterium]